MDLAPIAVSTGWAAGINAYLTVAVLGLLGRAGVGEVPHELQSDAIIALALVMAAVEFVVDKIPMLDSLWDLPSTAIRPAIASLVGAAFAGEADVSELDEALAAGGSGVTALASQGVKASIRLAVNSSPEPVTNVLVSLAEDGAVIAVTWFAQEEPVAAATIALTLLVSGVALAAFLASRIRRAVRALRTRLGRPPPS